MNSSNHNRLNHRSRPWLVALAMLAVTGCAQMEPAKIRIAEGPAISWKQKPTAPSINRSQSGYYTIAPGDALWAIAVVHGLDVEDLAAWNKIDNPDMLYVGQRLRLTPPQPKTAPSAKKSTASTKPLVSTPTKPLVSTPTKPLVSTPTKPLVTPPTKSLTATQPTRPLVSTPPGSPRMSTTLPIPNYNNPSLSGSSSALSSPVKKETISPPPQLSTSRTLSGNQRASVWENPPPAPTAKPKKRSIRKASANSASNSSRKKYGKSAFDKSKPPTRWRWPLKGKILSRFGKRGQGRNNGIDIQAKVGTPVLASAAGEVAYADSGLPGLGNLIILRHGGSYMTAYAYNQKLLVSRGEIVKAGQKIALSGQSGHAETPRLHFELRYSIKPLNPLKHLPH
ncbi:MAG: peptidoglycan DD-metalloendopeptidase family protein [Magnetococcales bacterium]|nr:peptidoglycan DD-metalloendopeptidase family protein [Magnetococcales bacterium]